MIMYCYFFLFFFFKQKTAYEMRISDWSSDVCSSDLASLFKLGVRLTLDEFGTGYSSLSYLRRAPFDSIKIGGNFFSEALEPDSRELALVKAIVALARALGMATLATGIESIELLKVLRG